MNRPLLSCVTVLLAVSAASAWEGKDLPSPSADEPLAKKLSLDKAGLALDAATLAWQREQNCASCHTTYAFLMARPALDPKAPLLLKFRAYFENRVENWDSPRESERLPAGSEGVSEVVATAATLAFDDARTGKLHPATRTALDRMWATQQKDGAWDWNKHSLPPLEFDDYFGATYAAMGVSFAPEDYAKSEEAKPGLAKLREYFRKTPPPNLHHKAWLMFASLRLDGLMKPAEREQTIKELLALQRSDGGWNLPSLGNWDRLDGTPNDPKSASDGYATGLTVYLLRRAGLPKDHKQVVRGVAWLKANQRESGRWFTRSVNADRDHYITNAGTAWAVLALKACE